MILKKCLVRENTRSVWDYLHVHNLFSIIPQKEFLCFVGPCSNKPKQCAGISIPSEEEEAFRHFFRVSKGTFEYICSLVREDLISRPPSGLINIEGRLLSVEKQVAIAMRRLASGDSQVSVGNAFGVGQSTVSQVLVSHFLVNGKYLYTCTMGG